VGPSRQQSVTVEPTQPVGTGPSKQPGSGNNLTEKYAYRKKIHPSVDMARTAGICGFVYMQVGFKYKKNAV
jgi:hypothetical protein